METTENIAYVRLSKRIQAVMIDSLFFAMALAASIGFVAWVDFSSETVESITALAPILLFEPLMVAYTGASPGHHIAGLRVRNIKADKNLNIVLAVVRFLVKTILGIPSLISVLTTRRHQALHDLIVKSIVVHKDPAKVASFEILSERVSDTETYHYPSKWQRFFVVCGYMVLSFIMLTLLSVLISSEGCLNYNRCSSFENVFIMVFSFGWYVSIFVIVGMGWQARLYGCRRKRIRDADEQNVNF